MQEEIPPARPAGSNDDRLERDLLGLANTGMGHVGRLPRVAMGSMVTATRARQAADRAFKWGDGAQGQIFQLNSNAS